MPAHAEVARCQLQDSPCPKLYSGTIRARLLCILVQMLPRRNLLLIALCIAPEAAYSQSPCIGVQFGAFGKSIIYTIAQKEGFFAQENLTVCYNQVTGSVQQFDSFENGTYDLISTAADNIVNRVANQSKPMVMLAGLDRGPGFVLAGNTANGIHSIADLKGKPIEVDAPDSGFVFALRRILKANGLLLENGDYSLRVVGGSFQRYQVLVAGSVVPPGGGPAQPSYATLLNSPFPQQAALGQPNITILARVSDYINPYQSGTIAATTQYVETHGDTIVSFLRATINAGLFFKNPQNCDRIIADIVSDQGLTVPVATAVLDEALSPVFGESPIALMSRTGLVNVIQLRAEFGGFTNPNINAYRPFLARRDGIRFQPRAEVRSFAILPVIPQCQPTSGAALVWPDLIASRARKIPFFLPFKPAHSKVCAA